MAANASPISRDDLCHTVYGTTAVQAATPPRSVVSVAGATFSDEPSRSLSSRTDLVPGVPLPYNSSLTSTTSCGVHVCQRLTFPATVDVNGVGARTKTRTPAQPQGEYDSATLGATGLSGLDDVELRQDDMFPIGLPRSGKVAFIRTVCAL